MKSFCQKCNNLSNKKILETDFDAKVVEYFSKKENGAIKNKFFSVHFIVTNITKCLGCDSFSLSVDEYRPESTDDEFVKKIIKELRDTGECLTLKPLTSITYPPKLKIEIPIWVKDLREDIMLLSLEVYKAYSLEMYSLVSMGIRTMIDSIATSKIGDIGGFNKKLEKLCEENYINKDELEILLSVIEIGHASSHRSYKPTKDQIDTCLNLLDYIMKKDYLLKSAEKLKLNIPKR